MLGQTKGQTMGNKNGPDTGDVRELLADADALLERAYYASGETDVTAAIARARAELARAESQR